MRLLILLFFLQGCVFFTSEQKEELRNELALKCSDLRFKLNQANCSLASRDLNEQPYCDGGIFNSFTESKTLKEIKFLKNEIEDCEEQLESQDFWL